MYVGSVGNLKDDDDDDDDDDNNNNNNNNNNENVLHTFGQCLKAGLQE
jgi:hypothetical protein